MVTWKNRWQYFSNYVKKENIAIDGKWLNGSVVNGQYQNENKGKKLPTGKITIAEIKRTCKYDDNFTAELFE